MDIRGEFISYACADGDPFSIAVCVSYTENDNYSVEEIRFSFEWQLNKR